MKQWRKSICKNLVCSNSQITKESNEEQKIYENFSYFINQILFQKIYFWEKSNGHNFGTINL